MPPELNLPRVAVHPLTEKADTSTETLAALSAAVDNLILGRSNNDARRNDSDSVLSSNHTGSSALPPTPPSQKTTNEDDSNNGNEGCANASNEISAHTDDADITHNELTNCTTTSHEEYTTDEANDDDTATGIYPLSFSTHVVKVDDSTHYRVPNYYIFLNKLGSGAYGTVAGFANQRTGATVAIKKVKDVFADLVDARRVLREIRVLRAVDHPNVLKLVDILAPESIFFEDIYIVTERMDSDLHRVIYSGQQITEKHVQYFMKQLLFGLRHLHALGVVHRDIKPSNILTNLDCHVKLCDFGLARGREGSLSSEHKPRAPSSSTATSSNESDTLSTPLLTDYVVTRWYRPPEVLLGLRRYTAAVDIWSAGCVFGELLKGEALFRGQNRYDQLLKILPYAQGSGRHDLGWLPRDSYGQHARRLLQKMGTEVTQASLLSLVPNTSAAASDLLKKMLQFRPDDRISIEEALRHPFLAGCRLEDPKPNTDAVQAPLDWSFDHFVATKQRLRSRMYQDVAFHHPEIIQRDIRFLREAGLEIVSPELAALSPPGSTVGCLRLREATPLPTEQDVMSCAVSERSQVFAPSAATTSSSFESQPVSPMMERGMSDGWYYPYLMTLLSPHQRQLSQVPSSPRGTPPLYLASGCYPMQLATTTTAMYFPPCMREHSSGSEAESGVSQSAEALQARRLQFSYWGETSIPHYQYKGPPRCPSALFHRPSEKPPLGPFEVSIATPYPNDNCQARIPWRYCETSNVGRRNNGPAAWNWQCSSRERQ